MLLAMESYHTWKTLGIEGAVRALKEAGFDAVDWSFYWDAKKAFCGEDYLEKAQEVKDALEKYGLKCNQAHAPFDMTYEKPWDDSCFDYLAIRRSIEAASIIGAKHIVVHGLRAPEGSVSKQSILENARYFRQMEPLCEKFGIKIAIENLMDSCTWPDLMKMLYEELNSPNFVLLVDIGHAWVRAGMQPGQFLRQIGPGLVKGLHVHDNHGVELCKDEHLLPYQGTIDYDDFYAALRETGYDGDFTLEIIHHMRTYAKQGLLPEALSFAHSLGRKMLEQSGL